LSDTQKQALHSKLDAMKNNRGPARELGDTSKAALANMNSTERYDAMQNIREERQTQHLDRANMTDKEREAHISQLMDNAREVRESRVSPYDQISMGLDTTEIVCGDGLELVIKVSNGLPRCLNPDTVVMLLDRGIVSYPE